MTKKHFIYAAKQIVKSSKENDEHFECMELYKCYLDFFIEFNDKFDVNIFNKFIQKELL